MPRTSGRKSKASSRKLVNVEGEDGWSTVSRKNNIESSKSQSAGTTLQNTRIPFGNTEYNDFSRIYENLTIPQMEQLSLCMESKAQATSVNLVLNFQPRPPDCKFPELRSRFERLRAEVAASTEHVALLTTITNNISLHFLSAVTKAVCLGLGSLSGDNSLHKRCSMLQLIMFLDIAQMLSGTCKNGNIALVAQDPAFNSADEAFLLDLNIQVVETPTAFSEIDATAFVFAPHYPILWWPSQMRAGIVPLIIANDLENTTIRIPNENELRTLFSKVAGANFNADIVDIHVKAELEQFRELYKSLPFPKLDLQEHAFSSLRIYWREVSR